MKTDTTSTPTWWTSLNHGGLLIAPARLAEHFHDDPPPLLGRFAVERLRRAVERLRDGGDKHLPELLEVLFDTVLGLEQSLWKRGSDVDQTWSVKAATGETLKPRWLWHWPNSVPLPVFIADHALGLGKTGRIGVGKGRRATSRVIEWLRKKDQKIALLTNGRQFRLLHAGPDYDAWCEWDAGSWFEAGEPGPQVLALRQLLGAAALNPRPDSQPPRLIQAILDSRRGQAELSSLLGERVREAVETLIQASSDVLAPLDQAGPARVLRRDLYIAATRLVMRCVVILFAEARELLPRDNPLYHGSYGLTGLREQLDREAGGRAKDRLRDRRSAWPRLLSLFRLLHDGSPHPSLPIPRYGGGLFRPGDAESRDSILRALAAIESPQNDVSDDVVHRILDFLTRSPVKVRQGNRSIWVDSPVDFSDLSSEYIGILYEGLLDFELRRAAEGEAMVFLNVGNQPVLPFSRLEPMSEKAIKGLLENFKKAAKAKVPGAEESDEQEEGDEDAEEADAAEGEQGEPEEGAEAEGGAPASPPELDGAAAPGDEHAVIHESISIWAGRAVEVARIIPRLTVKANPIARDRAKAAAAQNLIARVVLPGSWYLVRWGGTRKGAGTFYTRPQLAGPTVWRALRPLAYEPLGEKQGDGSGLAEPAEWRVRKPEEILALKVCDPAMGSGSFLVSALRFLTDALVESLRVHERLEPRGDGTVIKLADGVPSGDPSCESIPCPPDDPDFEPRLRARLMRYVVERCIYGVDLDPLAVELGRMALWVETMDREMGFGFLDHKLKCGNSLVGCWFDRFQEYPILAWEREGGDRNHDRFVHHFRERVLTSGPQKGQTERAGDRWTHAIKEARNDVIKPDVKRWILARSGDSFPFLRAGMTPAAVHREALSTFEEMHALPPHDIRGRERVFREKIEGSASLRGLKGAFHAWCAVWFWPGDALSVAPRPSDFLGPSAETAAVVDRLEKELRFFHWELEFPDVFSGEGAGFDALIGNPPWEIQKPNSKEFFSNVDPLYRGYGKQDALDKQNEYFAAEDGAIEEEWLGYCARLKALSNFARNAAFPCGDPDAADAGGRSFSFSRSASENQQLHARWRRQRQARAGFADPEHPFRHQGSADINTYKMFLECAHALARENGSFAFVVPSGLYTDKGSTTLRELLLDRCRWEWLFGFENREKIFDIHRSFKFGPIIARKGGQTRAIRTAFMHRSLSDWQDADRHVLAYPRERVLQFSPKSKALLEVRSDRDLEILEKMYRNGVLLGDKGPDGWGIEYATEFHMTNDSHLFPPRPKWEEKGFRSDEYGHWLKGGWRPYTGPKSILQRPDGLILSVDATQAIHANDIEDVALPLIQGAMLQQFDFSQKGWVRGTGLQATWEPIGWDRKVVSPQFLMARHHAAKRDACVVKPVIRRIARNTDARTFIGGLAPGFPCGDVASVLRPGEHRLCASLLCVINSFTCDRIVRDKCGGTHVDYHYIADVALAKPQSGAMQSLGVVGLALAGAHVAFSREWLPHRRNGRPLPRIWAIADHERLRLRCISEAMVADSYGLAWDDLAWLLHDCDLPQTRIRQRAAASQIDAKGFWRVDRDRDPELRLSVLAQVAFADLCQRGEQAFLSQNNAEGWMLPETLRLADYGLGHDSRAKEHQPVASRLGPRFYDWQLEQSVEESWEECERHAKLIARIVPLPGDETAAKDEAKDKRPRDLFGNPLPTDLFGNVIDEGARRRRRR